MRANLSILTFVFLYFFTTYSAADDERSLEIPIGFAAGKGVVSSAHYRTNAVRTVVSVLTTANYFGEHEKFSDIQTNVGKVVDKVPHSIARIDDIRRTLQRPLEELIRNAYGAAKTHMAILLLLIHPESVWRIDYAYSSNDNILEGLLRIRKECGVLDASRPVHLIQSGFKEINWDSALNEMSLPEVAQRVVALHEAHKMIQRVPTHFVILLNRKLWLPYFEQKKAASSWWHTITSIDYSAYLPSWPSKE